MNSKLPFFQFFFVGFFLASIVFAKVDAVDKFVQSQLAERNIPVVAIAVIKNGKIIKSKSYGSASVEFNVQKFQLR